MTTMRNVFCWLVFLFAASLAPLYAQTQSDRQILTPNSAIGQGYISDVTIFAGNVVTLNASGHLSLSSHTTVSGVLGVVRANGNSGLTLMVDEVGQSFVLVDGSCTTGNFVAKSTTNDGQGHCSSSLPSVELIGYANASLGSAGVVSVALNIGSGSTTGATSFATLAPGTNSTAGSFIATGNTWDFSAATLLRARIGAGLLTTVNGDFGYDTTNGNWHAWANGADHIVAVFSGSFANNNCAKISLVSGVVSIADNGAPCGSGSGGVTSVFGRAPVVVAAPGDYSLAQITATYNLPLSLSGNTLSIGSGCNTASCSFTALAPTASGQGDLIVSNGSSVWIDLPHNTSGTAFLQETSAGVVSWSSTAGFANQSLSNLASVALNSDLICASAGSCNLGSLLIPFNNLYFNGSIVNTSNSPWLWIGVEGSCSGAQTGKDVLCIGDLTTHQILESSNGGSFNPLPQVSGTLTVGHLLSIASLNPVILQDNGTSLLLAGIVDGLAPLTITTGSSASLGGTYKSGYTYNQEATAATAVTYTLPTAAAGLQYCVGNSYNGSAGDTGTLTLQTSASGQFLIYNGALSATGGFIISGGALGDKACVVGTDATHWEVYTQVGTWTLH